MTVKSPANILVVEDERIVARDLQRSLIGFGYDVPATAASSDQAIALASARLPDLVMMDIHIKGNRDGIETAAILRERFGVPVVFLTAYADSATVGRAKLTEPLGYLLKPVKANELRSVVEIALHKHGMERRLREREHWFATTLRSITDAVVTVDLAGIITFMNAAAEVLTGVAAADAVGRSAHDILQALDEHGHGIASSPIRSALRDRRSLVAADAVLHHAVTGEIRSISETTAPVIDDGRLLGAVMVFRDVTAQKLVQQQLELADRLASLGTMAAGVAHEVNNPLVVVVNNAAFIDDELAGLRVALATAGGGPETDRMEPIAHALADLRSAAQRIGRIVSDLTGFSRPAVNTSGRASVVAAVEWAVRTTAHELRHRARVVLTLHPVPMVEADEARLGQVFVNLLVNAAQAIAPGHLDDNQVVIETQVAPDGRVAIEIRDTGGGIAEEVRSRIFDPFFTTKPVGEGTGLGLSICHGIVTSLGGEITVASKPGAGTTFRILLPACAAAAAVVVELAAPAQLRRGRILAIDDEPMVLRAMARILRHHDVVCAESAEDALAMLERGERFDLIFSDLMMPGVDGVELYERLLVSRPEMARRMIFLSGGAITARADAFLCSVPNLRLAKPFDVRGMCSEVQRLLAEGAKNL